MPIGSSKYPDEALSSAARRALRDATVLFIDELQLDIDSLLTGGSFAETSVFDSLPARYLPSYDTRFLRRFLVCVVVVGWKLFDPAHEHRLSCLAEELALNAILRRAEAVLEEQDQEPEDLSYVEAIAFEDADFESLFDPSQDGIEDTSTGRNLGMANMKLSEWFEPFNTTRGDTVHPYAADAAWTET